MEHLGHSFSCLILWEWENRKFHSRTMTLHQIWGSWTPTAYLHRHSYSMYLSFLSEFESELLWILRWGIWLATGIVLGLWRNQLHRFPEYVSSKMRSQNFWRGETRRVNGLFQNCVDSSTEGLACREISPTLTEEQSGQMCRIHPPLFCHKQITPL